VSGDGFASRSGSVAIRMRSAFLAAVLSSLTTFALPLIWMYEGSKFFSMSTPSLLLGRSMMWPTDALTVKSLPRYLPMVFALAGDSTMTSDFIL
jgi:hypothetical protein